MGSLRSGGGWNGLQMEYAKNDDLQAVKPGMCATSKAAIAQQRFQKMDDSQQATGQVDQRVQRKDKRCKQIDQHYRPEQQGQ
ncbi:hypothetical protein VC35_15545 [Pseudomonas fluorescens]|uniref:Uncharacterized protein n=1 Tax=Pseudomonas fluorescens TaxID=294 RepID=A0A0F4TN58_PSEFL|nr:hypothetical protein VC35_15545 [Pseudomonas fluorescens]